MMLKNKKLLMLATAAIVAFPLTVVNAATTTIEASANFLQGLTLTNVSDVNFGTLDYSAAPSVAADIVTLGTNGTRTATGVFSAAGGTVAVGNILIAGTAGNTVYVRCDTTAILATAGGSTIEMDNISAVAEDATAAYGAGNCAGVGGAAATSFVLTATTRDNIIIGGRLDGTNITGAFGGAYSTTNAGGNDIEVTVFYI